MFIGTKRLSILYFSLADLYCQSDGGCILFFISTMTWVYKWISFWFTFVFWVSFFVWLKCCSSDQCSHGKSFTLKSYFYFFGILNTLRKKKENKDWFQINRTLFQIIWWYWNFGGRHPIFYFRKSFKAQTRKLCSKSYDEKHGNYSTSGKLSDRLK